MAGGEPREPSLGATVGPRLPRLAGREAGPINLPDPEPHVVLDLVHRRTSRHHVCLDHVGWRSAPGRSPVG
ncbi:MAG: hypothetical protein AVDCRST_MAG49-520 [uncultured Thermomicrobiales bacterium]|uniref:Uncharacterized protein n=1 Tax=uncultured Thermomicrobiales bacterium TaxID=1645740 RepID=A0A6J4U4B6_9BACT|nr:MAG: hypothetical protein AVDCRST_MAG49-520 [uncultured Thermomicrobiales bacterium]